MLGLLIMILYIIIPLIMRFFKKNYLESLDIFAQFFISPNLDKNLIDKEMKAVVSEFENDIRTDNWREYQLLRHVSKKESLMNKFTNGNYDTLKKDDIYEVLKNFHIENYSSNLMTLVIYQNKPIESILNSINLIFKDIKNNNKQKLDYKNFSFPFDKTNSGKIIKLESIKKEKKLKLFWYFESYFDHYKSQPLDIISHLIAHESEGSIHSCLYDQDLIYDLECSYFINENYYTEFYISLFLTEKGSNNIEKIISIISNYINLLKIDFIPKWIFDEIKLIKEFNFIYSDKENGEDRAIEICENAAMYSIEYFNHVEYMMDEYNPKDYKEILNKLNSENLLLFYSAQDLKDLPLKEPIYGTKYSIEDLNKNLKFSFDFPSKDYLEKLHFQDLKDLPLKEPIYGTKFNIGDLSKNLKISFDFPSKLHLPPKNYFVPKNFNLVQNENISKYPFDILNNKKEGLLYFKGDNKFNLPKINIKYKFYLEYLEKKNIINNINISFWIDILLIFLKKFIYLAEQAKIDFEVEKESRGFEIRINGFSDKIKIFINELSKKIKYFMEKISFELLEKYFNKAKKKAIIDLESFKKNKIYKRALSVQYVILLTKQWSINKKISTVKNYNFEEYKNFHKSFLMEFYYEGLYMGNLERSTCFQLNKIFIENIKKKEFKHLIKNKIEKKEVVKLLEKKSFIYKKLLSDKEEKNDCLLLTYQASSGELEHYKMLLLENYLKTPFFEELRTEKQLGYYVSSEFEEIQGQNFFYFIIQTNVTSSMKCIDYINEFLLKYLNLIKKIDDKIFLNMKESILKTFLQPFNNLEEESYYYWFSITEKTYKIDARERVSKIINGITKEDIINFYEDLFFIKKKILEIHYMSEKNIKENKELSEKRKNEKKDNLFEFEKEKILTETLELYPDIYLNN